MLRAKVLAKLPDQLTQGNVDWAMRQLDLAVEAIVSRHFKEFYATRRKPTRTRLWREVAADCSAQGLAPPGGFTANLPLDIVQIDHTKAEVTVVDPVTRRPLGRPMLTVAIDVNSRMVLGVYLSLEPPSLLSVALCLTQAVMDKLHELAAHGIGTNWPTRGVPNAIHVDNGAEFHARAFEFACSEYQIDLQHRPPGTPRYGDHIERLIGTMMGAVHLLPTSHFSNIFERGDAEAEAVMTLHELETWLALEIIGSYDARVHSALETTPSVVWAARSDEARLRMPADLRQFLVNFLPSQERVLQRDGLHLFHSRYWADEWRWLMGRESRKFTLKYARATSRASSTYRERDQRGQACRSDTARNHALGHRAARRALREAGRR